MLKPARLRSMAAPSFAFIAAGVLAACGEAAPPAVETGLRLAVAPLTLAGIDDACYDIEVTNDTQGNGEVVWSRGVPAFTRLGADQTQPPGQGRTATTDGNNADTGAVCSTRFGNATGGDITYIGPCDADTSGGTLQNGHRLNSVTLWVDGIYRDPGSGLADMEEWQDPCPAGCTLDFECVENQDTLVEFSFTIMRDANQGFFDVAVNFEDVFCSAKLDTCYSNGDHIELLHGADEVRDWTAVFGFACTAGAGDANTTLMYGDVAVVCGGTTFPIDPTLAEGNQSVTVGDDTLHYGIYRGAEQLDCDDLGTQAVESCNKLYWNLAFSLDDLALLTGETCTLAFSATAADGTAGFANGLPINTGIAYPYIDVDATLTDAGVASCQQNPLNATGSAVTTAYHGTVAGALALAPMCSFADATSTGWIGDSPCQGGLLLDAPTMTLVAENYGAGSPEFSFALSGTTTLPASTVLNVRVLTPFAPPWDEPLNVDTNVIPAAGGMNTFALTTPMLFPFGPGDYSVVVSGGGMTATTIVRPPLFTWFQFRQYGGAGGSITNTVEISGVTTEPEGATVSITGLESLGLTGLETTVIAGGPPGYRQYSLILPLAGPPPVDTYSMTATVGVHSRTSYVILSTGSIDTAVATCAGDPVTCDLQVTGTTASDLSTLSLMCISGDCASLPGWYPGYSVRDFWSIDGAGAFDVTLTNFQVYADGNAVPLAAGTYTVTVNDAYSSCPPPEGDFCGLYYVPGTTTMTVP